VRCSAAVSSRGCYDLRAAIAIATVGTYRAVFGTHRNTISKAVPMPSTLTHRRANAFRALRYSDRHAEVASLLAAGLDRGEIAQRTGYSRSHVSRISRMPEVREAVARHLSGVATEMLDAFARRLAATSRKLDDKLLRVIRLSSRCLHRANRRGGSRRRGSCVL
jgi:hypothetical protein